MPRTTPATALLGNTAGVSLLQGAYPAWISGGANITLSGTSGTGGYTLGIAGGAGGTGGGPSIAAGTQTATGGTVVFSNSNGVTFGLSGSSRVTASINAIGLATAATNVTWTVNSSGISISVASPGAGSGYPQALGYARI